MLQEELVKCCIVYKKLFKIHLVKRIQHCILLFRPILECALSFGSPLKAPSHNSDRIQNHALKFVVSDYSTYAGCPDIKRRLGWNLFCYHTLFFFFYLVKTICDWNVLADVYAADADRFYDILQRFPVEKIMSSCIYICVFLKSSRMHNLVMLNGSAAICVKKQINK